MWLCVVAAFIRRHFVHLESHGTGSSNHKDTVTQSVVVVVVIVSETMKHVLNLPQDTVVEYKPHKDAMVCFIKCML